MMANPLVNTGTILDIDIVSKVRVTFLPIDGDSYAYSSAFIDDSQRQ